jgi:NitT/TauT family transport system substrate-binding protein
MTRSILTRRGFMAAGAAAGSAAFLPHARAADGKLTFLTSWFAEAEHGGFYQAKALGLYQKAGLDVTIKMGGPQVNGLQLLTGGDADAMIGYDFQTLNSVAKGLPVKTIAASFQFDLQGVLAHPDVKSLGDLQGKRLLIASSAHSTYWPWLEKKFGYTDAMVGPYTFNLQPFVIDPNTEIQGYPSSEAFQAQKAGVPVNFFLFADYGYPPYGTTIVTTDGMLEKNGEVMQAFVKASMEGWRSYLTEDPTAANKLIQADNPKMPDDQLAFGRKWLHDNHALDRGEAGKAGIGTMTDARWQATHDFMEQSGLLVSPVDYRKAFTTKYVENLKIMMT